MRLTKFGFEELHEIENTDTAFDVLARIGTLDFQRNSEFFFCPEIVVFDALVAALSLPAGSFDRLIGSQQKTGGNVEPECLRGLQIDDQFKVGRLLDRQIRRLNAL
jgi:hypothetical protein